MFLKNSEMTVVPQSTNSNKQKNFEDVIVSSIGEFGRSQLIIVLGCKFPMFIGAWSMIMMSFAGAQPDWWLVAKGENTTANMTTVKRWYKRCPTHPNQTVVYDTKVYTIVSEWGLICSRDWIPNTISTAQMIGVLIGAGVSGQLAELIGRKKVLTMLFGMQIMTIFIEAFSVNWQMMIVCVSIVGFSLGGMLVVINCFMLEYVSIKWRTISGILPFWGAGVMMFGVLFKILPNWRHLCMATGVLGLPVFIYLFLIPESLRWLFTQGRFEEGKRILCKLAKRNGRKEPDLSLLGETIKRELEQERKNKKYTYWTLLKFQSTRWKIPLFSYMWFFSAFGYYALTLGVGKLSGDITVNMILMGIGEMFSLVLVWLFSKCYGRKRTTIILWAATAFSSFVITIAYFAASDTKFKLYTNIFALMSRFFLAAGWQSLILFTVETFPTVIRSVAYGFVSVFGRVGGIAGTQNNSLSKISEHIPFTVNGVLATGCAFACIFLTDTYFSQMEDFLEEENVDIGTEEKTSSKV